MMNVTKIVRTALTAGVVAAVLLLPRIVSTPVAAEFPNDRATIAHVLNRIAFGARPGDAEQVERIGLRQYIDQQLHPEKIADAGMTERLAGLKTIGLSSREISEQFEQPALQMRRQRQQAGQNQNNDQNGRPTPEVMAMQQ